MSDKIYVGNGKAHKFGVHISICLSDLPKEHIQTAKNGKKYINLSVKSKKETDKYNNTHYVEINTWKPDKEESKENTKPNDDLPF
jgi:hypothetical protein